MKTIIGSTLVSSQLDDSVAVEVSIDIDRSPN